MHKHIKSSFYLLGILSIIFITAPSSVSAASLSPLETQGKKIFLHGISATGAPITARFGKEGIKLAGKAVACTTCHGYDGLGRSESGITGSDITWSNLTKPYEHVHPSGFKHQPFTENILKNYLVTGRYPGGQKGDPSMPLYSLAEEDRNAVMAYLKRVEGDLDPGVTETEIRVGTIFPSEGSSAEMAEEMGKTIQGYFAEINANGGIYGRRLELVVERTGQGALPKERLKSWLDRSEVFVLLSTVSPGMERDVASVAEEEGVPLIGPFTMFPLESSSLNRSVFYLLSGLREQIRAMAAFAEKRFGAGNPKVAVVYPSRNEVVGVIEDDGGVFSGKGFGAVRKNRYSADGFSAAGMVDTLKKDGADVVLFLGNASETGALLREAERQAWTPHFLLSGVLMGKAVYSIAPMWKDKVHIAYPTLPADMKEWGMREFALVSGLENSPAAHLPARQSAYAAARIMVEGLRRAGRDLRRERFLSVMEKMTDYDTGLTPPISYDRNRRIGAMGAYVVTVDPERPTGKEFISSQEWVEAY